jgi:hypothetical protein
MKFKLIMILVPDILKNGEALAIVFGKLVGKPGRVTL